MNQQLSNIWDQVHTTGGIIHSSLIEKFGELAWKEGYKAGMNAMIQANMNNSVYQKAMDDFYEQKWAHRFD